MITLGWQHFLSHSWSDLFGVCVAWIKTASDKLGGWVAKVSADVGWVLLLRNNLVGIFVLFPLTVPSETFRKMVVNQGMWLTAIQGVIRSPSDRNSNSEKSVFVCACKHACVCWVQVWSQLDLELKYKNTATHRWQMLFLGQPPPLCTSKSPETMCQILSQDSEVNWDVLVIF